MMNMRINQQLLFSIVLLWHFSILATAQGTETKQHGWMGAIPKSTASTTILLMKAIMESR